MHSYSRRACPLAFRTEHGLPLYFEAAAVIVTLVLLGQVLELRARSKTSSAISELLKLAPTTAFRASRPTGPKPRLLWRALRSATSFASSPAPRFPSMVWSPKALPVSTSRC